MSDVISNELLEDVRRISKAYIRDTHPDEYAFFDLVWNPVRDLILAWERSTVPEWPAFSGAGIATAFGASDRIGVNVATLKAVLVTAATMKDLATMTGAATLDEVCEIVTDYSQKVEMEHGMQQLCESIFRVRYGQAEQGTKTTAKGSTQSTDDSGIRVESTPGVDIEDNYWEIIDGRKCARTWKEIVDWRGARASDGVDVRSSYDLWISEPDAEFFFRGQTIKKMLTPMPIRILTAIVKQRGDLCSWKRFRAEVWNNDTVGSPDSPNNTVHRHVKRVTESVPAALGSLILPVRGRGYKLTTPITHYIVLYRQNLER